MAWWLSGAGALRRLSSVFRRSALLFGFIGLWVQQAQRNRLVAVGFRREAETAQFFAWGFRRTMAAAVYSDSDLAAHKAATLPRREVLGLGGARIHPLSELTAPDRVPQLTDADLAGHLYSLTVPNLTHVWGEQSAPAGWNQLNKGDKVRALLAARRVPPGGDGAPPAVVTPAQVDHLLHALHSTSQTNDATPVLSLSVGDRTLAVFEAVGAHKVLNESLFTTGFAVVQGLGTQGD